MNTHQINRLLDQAQQFADDGKWLHASQLYQRILNEEPDYTDVYFRLANAYIELRNLMAAEQVLLNALKRNHENADIIFALGSLHLRAEEYDNAIHYFEQLIPLRLPQVHFSIGLIYFMKNNLANAERHFRLTLEYDPEFPKANQSLGEVLLKAGEAKESIRFLQKSISQESDSWVSYFMLGVAYSINKMWDKSIQALQTSLEMNPSDADAMRLCADAFIQSYRLDEAETYLKSALALDNTSAEIHASMAQLALARSDKKAAKKYFTKALDLDSTNFRALEGLHLLQPHEHTE